MQRRRNTGKEKNKNILGRKVYFFAEEKEKKGGKYLVKEKI